MTFTACPPTSSPIGGDSWALPVRIHSAAPFRLDPSPLHTSPKIPAGEQALSVLETRWRNAACQPSPVGAVTDAAQPTAADLGQHTVAALVPKIF